MEQVSISTEDKPKRGRPATPKLDVQELLERIDNLEACISKIATLGGSANYLNEFGLKRWEPSKSDMSKYKG